MLPNLTISFAGHTIHLSNFDLALGCAVIFALAIVELAFALGKRAASRRASLISDKIAGQVERIERLLQRITADMAARPDTRCSASDEGSPNVPAPQRAEWRKAKSKPSIPYSMFGR